MNEFKKEELEELESHLTGCLETYQEPDSLYALRDKIQCMIDNYCEHEVENIKNEIPMYAIYIKKCTKCNKKLI